MSESFQKLATQQGDLFSVECLHALRYAGFTLLETEQALPEVGISLSAITVNKQRVVMAWEFRGSLRGSRAGLLRTDTVKKVVANAYLLSVCGWQPTIPPLFVITSHQPEGGAGRAMLATAIRQGLVALVMDSRDGELLGKLAAMSKEEMETVVRAYREKEGV